MVSPTSCPSAGGSCVPQLPSSVSDIIHLLYTPHSAVEQFYCLCKWDLRWFQRRTSLLGSRHFPQSVSTGEYCCSEPLLSILSVIAQSSKHWSSWTRNVALSWDHKSESPTCHPSLGQTVVSCIYSGCLPARITSPGLFDCLPGCLSPCGIWTCMSLVRSLPALYVLA